MAFEPEILIFPLVTFLISLVVTRVVLWWLRRKSILDMPNVRSNHTVPTPRGGGIAIMAVITAGWPFLHHHWILTDTHTPLLLAMLLLAVVSWIDDRKSLPASRRFLIQLIAVSLCMHLVVGKHETFQGLLPLWLDQLGTALIWIWFINLFNFMDGIDGITGMETLFLCSGLGLLGFFTDLDPVTVYLPLLIGGATAGFLVFNWSPARLFMGDVGSIPLGFLLGWLLLDLAQQGYWIPALILPAYYLADSSLTLLKRLLRGERIWHPHSEHAYQHAARAWHSHSRVVLTIACYNVLLLVLALASGLHLATAYWVLPIALLVTTMLIWHLRKAQPR